MWYARLARNGCRPFSASRKRRASWRNLQGVYWLIGVLFYGSGCASPRRCGSESRTWSSRTSHPGSRRQRQQRIGSRYCPLAGRPICARTSKRSGSSTDRRSSAASEVSSYRSRSNENIRALIWIGVGSTCFRRRAHRSIRVPTRAGAITFSRTAVQRHVRERRSRCRHRKAGVTPHVPPQLRDTSAGKRLRHSDGAGADGPQRCVNDADLHARHDQGNQLGEEPVRY